MLTHRARTDGVVRNPRPLPSSVWILMKQHLHHLLLHEKAKFQRVYLLVVIIHTSTVSGVCGSGVSKLSFGSQACSRGLGRAWSPRGWTQGRSPASR